MLHLFVRKTRKLLYLFAIKNLHHREENETFNHNKVSSGFEVQNYAYLSEHEIYNTSLLARKILPSSTYISNRKLGF